MTINTQKMVNSTKTKVFTPTVRFAEIFVLNLKNGKTDNVTFRAQTAKSENSTAKRCDAVRENVVIK